MLNQSSTVLHFKGNILEWLTLVEEMAIALDTQTQAHKHLTQISYITHFNNVVIQKWRISLDILYYLTNESRYVEYNKLFSGALYFFSVSYIMVPIGSSFRSQL